MRMIYKYELSLGPQAVMMPAGAQILSVHVQRDSLCMWALVDPHAKRENRGFVVVGTGNAIGEEVLLHTFIGTVLMGPFVWHVFELLK